VIVQALKPHRALGQPRALNSVYHIDDTTGAHLVGLGFCRTVLSNEEWHSYPGRELRTEPLGSRPWPLVVGCLNIWNDLAALQRTLPTWLPHLDALVVADGRYRGGMSSDGLDAFLRTLTLPVEYLSRHWSSQSDKRTRLLQAASKSYPDSLLLVIDADEFLVIDGSARDLPEGDVGWVTVQSTAYQRPYGQPRLIRARPDLRYDGRHHWLYAGERLLATHQYGGPGFEHRLAPVYLRNQRGLGHTAERWRAKQEIQELQREAERAVTTGAVASDQRSSAREALRIACTTTYDPGMVAFRFHTAINTTTPHASVFFRRGCDNPFDAPRQYDPDVDPALGRKMLSEANVVHCHLDTTIPDSLSVNPKWLVLHHHGTMFRTRRHHDTRAKLTLVSNLELLSYGQGQDLHFLPNPVSVARLRRLRGETVARKSDSDVRNVRIGHSPSKRHLKGTAEFLAACDALHRKKLPIEVVLIEGQSHRDALAMKATCDLFFDSFWLGLQCSGIEAAAMGLPVVAGDHTVADRYCEMIGETPYTFANTEADLVQVLERMVVDPDWRQAQADRVLAYVERWHDDAAVTLRYLDLLDAAVGWRRQLTKPGVVEAA